jgi:hypothetical protein
MIASGQKRAEQLVTSAKLPMIKLSARLLIGYQTEYFGGVLASDDQPERAAVDGMTDGISACVQTAVNRLVKVSNILAVHKNSHFISD